LSAFITGLTKGIILIDSTIKDMIVQLATSVKSIKNIQNPVTVLENSQRTMVFGCLTVAVKKAAPLGPGIHPGNSQKIWFSRRGQWE
jgi:hypothetical protein